MKLKLNGIDVNCFIGERPDERERLQHLRVDVELTVPETAARTDRLEDTVDYVALTERVRAALTAAKCRMIERAAVVVAETCLAEPLVKSVRVSVVKAGAIAHLESAEAVYEQSR